MAETGRANLPTVRRNAKSKALRSLLGVHRGAVCHELPQPAVYQIKVRSTTIVHQLILRVVPSAKFIKLFLRWLLAKLYNPAIRLTRIINLRRRFRYRSANIRKIFKCRMMCSITTRSFANSLLNSFCSSVNSPPFGFLNGVREFSCNSSKP